MWCELSDVVGVIRCERYDAECCLDVRDDRRKEMHEKSKLSMMKWITECDVKG